MEIVKRIKAVLKSKDGGSIFTAAFIPLLLLIIVTIGYEYIRLQVIAQGTRDGVQSVISETCTSNYARLYDGLREGYSGGYKLSGSSWSDDVDSSVAYSALDRELGTQPDGSGHAKYNSGGLEYRISDLSIHMTNAPFAPDTGNGPQQFTGTAEYTLTVPMSFGWQGLPPLTIPMVVQSGYTQKF